MLYYVALCCIVCCIMLHYMILCYSLLYDTSLFVFYKRMCHSTLRMLTELKYMCVDSYYRFMLFLVSYHLVSYHVVSYNSSDRKNVCQCIHSNTLFLSLFILCYAMLCSHNVSNDCRISKTYMMQLDAAWCTLIQHSIRWHAFLSYDATWYMIYCQNICDAWFLMSDIWRKSLFATWHIDMAWHMIWHLFIYLLFSHDGSMHALLPASHGLYMHFIPTARLRPPTTVRHPSTSLQQRQQQ